MQTRPAPRLEEPAPRLERTARNTGRTAGRFDWIKLTVLGGAIIALAPVLPILSHGFDPFFAILIVPPLIGLVLIRFARKTGIVWLGVVSLALLVMSAGFIPDALMHPESPTDFVPVTMLTVGGLLAISAAVPAFRAARGRATGSVLPMVLGGAGLALVVVAVAVSMVAKGTIASDAPAVGSTVVAMEDFAFGPETINAESGEVTLYVTNNDSARHTFTVDELGVDVSIAPGQSRQITFDAGAGEYRFYCKPHDPGMEGDLVVR